MVKNSFVSLPLEATRPSCGLRARGDTYFFAMADALFVAYVFIFHVLVFLCLSRSLSVYRGSWRMYVVPVIAQHNGMALCQHCCLPGTT